MVKPGGSLTCIIHDAMREMPEALALHCVRQFDAFGSVFLYLKAETVYLQGVGLLLEILVNDSG